MFIFLGLSFLAKPSFDSRTTFARQSHNVRENVVRRSMVINTRNFIGRTSCECLANVARMSRECRETFANYSCDNRTDVAHSIGVQDGFLHFFCLQEPFFDVLVIFFVLKLKVYVCLVKSLLILSFYLSKQLKESLGTKNLVVIPL